MAHHNRLKALAYLIIASIGMLLLAAGLPALQFQPGLPIPGAETQSHSTGSIESPVISNEVGAPGILQIVLLLGIIAFFIGLVFYLLKKTNFKFVPQILVGTFVLLVAAIFLGRLNQIQSSWEFRIADDAQSRTATTYQIAPIGDPPAELIRFVVGGLILLSVLLLGWLLYKAFHNSHREDPLAREAALALNAIEEGQDLHDVILRCYRQMLTLVKEERGIEREQSVTPREFEDLLIAGGITPAPTHQMTLLFERARYSRTPPDDRDKHAAVECLSAIREACRAGAGAAK